MHIQIYLRKNVLYTIFKGDLDKISEKAKTFVMFAPQD